MATNFQVLAERGEQLELVPKGGALRFWGRSLRAIHVPFCVDGGEPRTAELALPGIDDLLATNDDGEADRYRATGTTVDGRSFTVGADFVTTGAKALGWDDDLTHTFSPEHTDLYCLKGLVFEGAAGYAPVGDLLESDRGRRLTSRLA